MKITPLFATLALASTTAFSFANANVGGIDHHNSAIAMEQKAPMSAAMKTDMFTGIEVKKGAVEFYQKDGKNRLRVTAGFEIPTSPAPHWQIVDKQGNVFLLNQFRLAGDKTNLDIVLPSYIKSISKVQVWCSFAEVVLGEARFSKAVELK